MSLLLLPIHRLALPFWLVLTRTSDPGRLLGPSSHASSGPSSVQRWQGGQEWLLGSSPPPYALPKLGQGAICPGGTPHIALLRMAHRPKSFHRHAYVHVGELPGLCLSWHLGSSSHLPCSQPALKLISRAGRPRPSPCMVPTGSAGSTASPLSATAAGDAGSPCTTHLSLGSKPVCSVCGEWGPSCRCPSSCSGCTGALWDCANSEEISVFKVLFQVETLLFKSGWVLQMSGGFA